ncbi:response regulator [Ideonella sp.]|uniref:hybrid sensor histidine kinase/response regulator n=1 Tax=Ideonella sp. TaxID=1929293 RepID=UPI0035B3B83E
MNGDTAPGAEAALTRMVHGPVLVVDDNPATRYATTRVLRAAGLQTLEAATGLEALEIASADVAAVVLDVNLPDMDGFEVCRRLREQPATARVPVIHLSATYVRDEHKLRGLNAGADAYMTHPAEPALLVATVLALVRARTAEDAMRRSEARLRAIFDHAQSGICLLDEAGQVVEANPALLALLQRDAAEVIGRPVEAFAPPGRGAGLAAFLRQGNGEVRRAEFPLLTATGRLVELEWSLSRHVEPGMQLAMLHDISERLTLAAQREQLLEREQAARGVAEHLSRTKDEFVAVLSHELRTPLNAILNWAQVLQRRGDDAAQRQRGLQAIVRSATTQSRLIADLLDASRLGMGKLRLQRAEVDVEAAAAEAIEALAVPAGDKDVQVVLQADAGLPRLHADPARLQQIIWNLLSNAIKFSERGGTVRLGLQAVNDTLEIVVQDAGRGIEPDFLPFLFDRFTQGDAASNRLHGGLGLGLAIVQRLVAMHGGTVRGHSAGPGQGATFVVALPLHDTGAAAETDLPVSTPMPLDGVADLGGVQVLVVEDDTESRDMLLLILRDHGAQVRGAASHAEAMQAWADARPQVLVSDIGLPGQDGYDLIRDLRAAEGATGARVPAIALTAFARPKDRANALQAGYDAHVAKPLQPAELINTIARLVRPGP